MITQFDIRFKSIINVVRNFLIFFIIIGNISEIIINIKTGTEKG